ncbi:hypothetical protein JQX13_25900 [Archangium violaceum]|uniref:hypothetical protein n=1 Tax=Archangium violaceum TaxID=83451 RepID=UPI00193BA120|nr:hypothetical protein [Archangium violaceum]QRK13158.1 hypothetical protein JQX13_25900 [Archangium violaceum]
MRLENSISDEFDDAMIVFFKMLEGAKLADFEKTVEETLRKDLEKVLAKNKDKVKFIPCSKGLWVAAKLQISTEPGMEVRRDRLRSALSQQEAAIAKNGAGADKCKEELKAINEQLPLAEQELTKAKEGKDKKLIARLTLKVGGLKEKQTRLTARSATLEEKGKELEAKRVKLEAEFIAAEKPKNDDPELFGINEGNEGWYEEEKAILLPRHYADAFSFFIHKISSVNTFAKDTSMVALTTGYLEASRIFSIRRVCAERVDTFQGKNRVVRQVRSVAGKDRLFHDDSVILELRKNDAGVMEAYLKENETLTKLAPEDQVLIKVPLGDKAIQVVGGTNLHRAHNVELQQDGTLKEAGGPQWRVDSWSDGCQVFPRFDEFNLFIRLCAISKRWRCASGATRAGEKECVVLEASDTDERGAGEQALVDRFGEDFVNKAADLNRGNSKVLNRIEELVRRRRDFEWTDKDESRLSELETAKKEAESKKEVVGKKEVAGKLDKASLKEMEKLNVKKAKAFTQAEADESQKLTAERDAWRRAYMRDKTKRLRADHMQVCDMAGKCRQPFSYTLVELTVSQWSDLGAYFGQARNKAWDGTLVIGGKKVEPTAKAEPASAPVPNPASESTNATAGATP